MPEFETGRAEALNPMAVDRYREDFHVVAEAIAFVAENLEPDGCSLHGDAMECFGSGIALALAKRGYVIGKNAEGARMIVAGVDAFLGKGARA